MQLEAGTQVFAQTIMTRNELDQGQLLLVAIENLFHDLNKLTENAPIHDLKFECKPLVSMNDKVSQSFTSSDNMILRIRGMV
jgi:hypothetical protein